MAVLQPGFYYIELETTRPVEQSTLARVMAAMGFTRVVPDQMPEAVTPSTGAGAPGLGGAFTSAVQKTLATRKVSSQMFTPAARAAQKAVTAPTKAKVELASSAMIRPPPPMPRYVQPVPAVSARKKVAAAISSKPAPKQKTPGMFEGLPGGGGGGGGSGEPAPTEPTPQEPGAVPGEPEPSIDYPQIPLGPGPEGGGGTYPGGEGGGGGGGGGGGYSYPGGEGVSAPGQDYYVPTSLASLPTAATLESVLPAMWKAWRDYGNPFATTKTSGIRVAGRVKPQQAPPPPRTYRLRMLAELSQPLHTQDTDLVRWLSAVPLTIDPFASMSFELNPYQLRNGRDYELRFVSRARSAPTREATLNLLTSMGWETKRLTAIKRHMRLPGQQGANLTLWYGIGRWQKPESRIVSEDPFYFEDVAEIT